MTKETRTVIDLSDIVSVEFECQTCHSIYTVSISVYNDNLEYCPQCRSRLVPAKPGNADAAIRQMITKLKEVMEMINNPDLKLGMKIRFQFVDEGRDFTSASGRASGGRD